MSMVKGTSAQHVADIGIDKPKRRRTAKARREQKSRAELRAISRILKAADNMQHRGCDNTVIGKAFTQALQSTASGSQQQRPQQTMQTCRHWLAGKCTWGERCNFLHGYSHDHDHQYHDDYHDVSVNLDGDCDDQNGEYNDINNEDDDNTTSQAAYEHDTHNYKDDIDSNHEQHNNDEMDDIIAVINSLAEDPDSQQQAIELLPPHLLHEAMSRLEQQLNYDHNHDSGEDDEHKDAHTSDVVQSNSDDSTMPRLYFPASNTYGSYDTPVTLKGLFGYSNYDVTAEIVAKNQTDRRHDVDDAQPDVQPLGGKLTPNNQKRRRRRRHKPMQIPTKEQISEIILTSDCESTAELDLHARTTTK